MTNKSRFWMAGVLGAAMAVAAGAYVVGDWVTAARIATAYSAKTVCSCLHVADRRFADCMGDLPDEASDIVSVKAADGRVIAKAFGGLVSAHASHTPNYGCAITR